MSNKMNIGQVKMGIRTLFKKKRNNRKKQVGSAVPYVDVSERHIRNLKVLTDRQAFLELMPKGSVVAEIGVNKGEFSSQILSQTTPKKLHLVDSWGDERYHDGLMTMVQDKFKNEIQSGRIIINRGLSYGELEKFPDGYFDWVYVDTAHSYKTTSKELEICRIKVKNGGIIAGHDYVIWGWHGRVRYGVVEAVNEFCVKYDWEMIFLTHETDRQLSFAIKKIQGNEKEAL